MVWPTLGSKTAKEQNSLLTYLYESSAQGVQGAPPAMHCCVVVTEKHSFRITSRLNIK